MANRQVALIRGINVGRAKRVAMAELRALVESLGYGDVRTLLNSGNVVFSTPRATPGKAGVRIEKALETELGVVARVTVLAAKELAAAVTDNPLLEFAKDPSRLLVAVLSNPADRAEAGAVDEARLEAGGSGGSARRGLTSECGEGILASRLAEAVGRTLGDAMTARNWATVLKLQGLIEEQR